MILRVWRGWTTPANADAYQQLLLTTIFPGIAARQIAGYHGIQLGRRKDGERVEFMTTMYFESLDAVQAFAGADWETAVVPPAARALLADFDARSAHYEMLHDAATGRRAG